MADILCGYTADRDETLIAYLYGESDGGPRAAFEAHLATCERCRHELAELRGMRTSLQAWTPPEAAVAGGGSLFGSPVRRRGAWLREIPVWAQAAAALLVLGVSAGLANLNVRYDGNGLTIRTGWTGAAPSAVSRSASDPSTGATTAPWRADLDALEQRLRAEAAAAPVRTQDAADVSDAQVLRRVRALIQESERKQQNEVALRIAEVAREFDTKRGSDLANIDRSIRTLQSNTGIEVARYGQIVNYLANRVSLQK
jgi:putative zinc finger protein